MSSIDDEYFNKLKNISCNAPLVKFLDVNAPVVIQCDASKNGLVTCLFQNSQPVAYSTRALNLKVYLN